MSASRSVPPRRPTYPPSPASTRHAVRHGTASFELEPPDEAEMTRAMRALARRRLSVSGRGEPTARVAGLCLCGPLPRAPAYRFSVENSVYVAPDAHRRGIGRALLERLIAECEARGYRLMIAVIGDSAQTPSIELHRAAGFRCRRVRGRRLQVRSLARHRADAARARERHVGAAVAHAWRAEQGRNRDHDLSRTCDRRYGFRARLGRRNDAATSPPASATCRPRAARLSSSCPRLTISPVAEITL